VNICHTPAELTVFPYAFEDLKFSVNTVLYSTVSHPFNFIRVNIKHTHMCVIYIYIYTRATLEESLCSLLSYIYFTHTHTHTHTHAHAHMRTRAHTHTHTHTVLVCSFKSGVIHCLVMLTKLVSRYWVISPSLITLYNAQIEIRPVWRILFPILNSLLTSVK